MKVKVVKANDCDCANHVCISYSHWTGACTQLRAGEHKSQNDQLVCKLKGQLARLASNASLVTRKLLPQMPQWQSQSCQLVTDLTKRGVPFFPVVRVTLSTEESSESCRTDVKSGTSGFA